MKTRTLPALPMAIEGAAWIARLGLAAVLLYAGAIKASDSAEFALALIPFTIVPESFIGPMALLLPWIEIALGIGLLTRFHRPAALATALLFIVFACALGWALAEDIVVSCGCFGREDEPPSAGRMRLAMLRNAVLAAAAMFVALRRARFREDGDCGERARC